MVEKSCVNCKHWEKMSSQEKFLKTVPMGRCVVGGDKVYSVETSLCERWSDWVEEVSEDYYDKLVY